MRRWAVCQQDGATMGQWTGQKDSYSFISNCSGVAQTSGPSLCPGGPCDNSPYGELPIRAIVSHERPEHARHHAVTTRSNSSGCPCNPWSKAKNSSFLMASGDARHRVSLGKRRSAVLKDHFGPQISLISYPSLKRANEQSPGNSGRAFFS